MPFDPELFGQVQLLKHLGDNEHDQKDHGRKKSKKSDGKNSESLKDRMTDFDIGDGDLSLGEATAAAAVATAVGLIGFKKGAHRKVKFAISGNKMTTAHDLDAFKKVDDAGLKATMIGDNLNGIGKHTANYHPGEKFWATHSSSGAVDDVINEMQHSIGNWTGGMHKTYNQSLTDPVKHSFKHGSPEMLQAISTSAVPPEVGDLHRGLSLGDGDELRLHGGDTIKLADIKPGVEFDLLPESFSSRKAVAAKFGTGYGLNSTPNTGGYVDTVITVKKLPQRTGLNVDPVTKPVYSFEDEWIMGGTFKVTEVKTNTLFAGKPTKRHLIVEQVAPPDFDYQRAKSIQRRADDALYRMLDLKSEGINGFDLPDGLTMNDVRKSYGSTDPIKVVVKGSDGFSAPIEMTALEIGYLDKEFNQPKSSLFASGFDKPVEPKTPVIDTWEFEGKPQEEFSAALEAAYISAPASQVPSGVIDELVKEPPPGGTNYDKGGAYEKWIKGLSPQAIKTYFEINDYEPWTIGFDPEELPNYLASK